MPKKEQIILPDKYYLDYFIYLLGFLQKHYDHVLDVPEYLFISEFNNLSEDAKCLYIRLINRKGPFFRLSKISYPEIGELQSAYQELHHNDFIDVNQHDDLRQFQLFTKNELLELFPFFQSSQRKQEMLTELTESDVDILHQQEEILEVKKGEIVDFFKLLFFGNRYQQMTEFVIRDIGNIKLQELDEERFTPWFQTREDALGMMHLSQLKPLVRQILGTDLPLEEFIGEVPWEEWLKYPRSSESAEKLLLEIASHFERSQMLEEAVKYYNYISMPPAGERRIRLYEKLGESENALKTAQSLIQDPANASELTFALDYLNRSGIRIDRSTTKRLKQAEILDLKISEKRVEQAVLEHFIGKGWSGIHGENFMWRGLFGLTFWSELFSEDFGAFHHPLQRQPSDLHDAAFYNEREPLYKSRLKNLKTKKSYWKYIQKVHNENDGFSNRFVYWHEQLLQILEIMIQQLPLKGLKEVMLEIAKQTKENSTGFPDLFLWRENEYHFYEVKSPNDHLSAQQLFWINFLSKANINVEILKINYVE